MFHALPSLGVGLGYRTVFKSDLFLHRPRVDFLELIADHFLNCSSEKEAELELLRDHFPLIPHGLNLSLGSAEGIDEMYLRKLAALVKKLDPPWWSEHIAFTGAGGVSIGHLSPLPFIREAIDVFCRNVARVREAIEHPLILENITYTVNVPGGEMTESDFLCEILQRTGCGLLLDVTNLYTNAANHGYDPVEFLQQLPLERIVQLHFVGGTESEGLLIDSHSQATPEPVWSLLETVVSRARVRGMILERDENIPAFSEILAELDRARSIGRKYERWPWQNSK
jgi:uncharacterized protein (UPF0276 family)